MSANSKRIILLAVLFTIVIVVGVFIFVVIASTNDCRNSRNKGNLGSGYHKGIFGIYKYYPIDSFKSCAFGILKIVGADKKSFVVLSSNLSKDKNQVYFFQDVPEESATVIQNADPATFTVITPVEEAEYYKYAKDKTRVYISDRFGIGVISGANPKTFRQIRYEFTQDDSQVYLIDKAIDGVDAETFEVLDYNTAKDKNHIYTREEILNRSDNLLFP